MGLIRYSVSFLFLVLLVSNVSAQDDSSSGGFSPAIAAYGSLWDTQSKPGFGAGGKLEIPLYDFIKLEGRSGFISRAEVPHSEPLTGGSRLKVDLVPIDFGLALHLPGRLFDVARSYNVRPLVFGGASWVSVSPGSGYRVSDVWGWYAGGGLEIGPEDGFGILFEAMYRGSMDITVRSQDGIHFDQDLNGASGNLGFYYRW
jgi:hypothetical protein